MHSVRDEAPEPQPPQSGTEGSHEVTPITSSEPKKPKVRKKRTPLEYTPLRYQRIPCGGIGLVVRRADDTSDQYQLTNFVLHIVKEEHVDDGVEQVIWYTIESSLENNVKRTTRIRASEFHSLQWIEESAGVAALIYPVISRYKDHVACAIKYLSEGAPVERVYCHTGYTTVDGTEVYLSTGVIITSDGVASGIQVELEGTLSRYSLPQPPVDEALKTAVRASIALISIAPDRITIPLLGMTYRAAIGDNTMAGFIVGRTGEGKSELAALMQQHYGPCMDAQHLPASYQSTANALEQCAFYVKDAVLVIDDYVPKGSVSNVQQLKEKAERLGRAQGNRQGRARLTRDSRLVAAKPPRGLMLSTGEDGPEGGSLLARTLIVELNRGDLRWQWLSLCQQRAKCGVYASAMSGFIRCMLGKGRSVIQRRLMEEARRLQGAHLECHKRISMNISELAATWEIVLEFAAEVGAISGEECSSLRKHCSTALLKLAAVQQQYQGSADPVEHFFDVLRGVLASHNGHINGIDGCRPQNSEVMGWYQTDESAYCPGGCCIGWIDGEDVFLEQEATLACVHRFGGPNVNGGLTLQLDTLRKRMRDAGALVSTDQSRETLYIRKTIHGQPYKVLHVALQSIFPGGSEVLSGGGHETAGSCQVT